MEYSFYKHLESTGVDICDIGYEAIRIPYRSGKRERSYIPDFLVGRELYEVKPVVRQKGRVFADKMAAAFRFCADRGISFKIVSERDFRIFTLKESILDPYVHVRVPGRKRSRK